MRLHLATGTDAEGCLALLHDYGEQEHFQLGVVGWTHPRVRRVVQADARAGRLYAIHDGERLVATFALCAEPDPYYAAVQWADPAARAMYLHRLAVSPDRRGTGLGTWCVAQAERLATTEGYAFLRLDALQHHPRVLGFYRRLGYTDRGIAPADSGNPENPIVNLICFEKRMPDDPPPSAPTRTSY